MWDPIVHRVDDAGVYLVPVVGERSYYLFMHFASFYVDKVGRIFNHRHFGFHDANAVDGAKE